MLLSSKREENDENWDRTEVKKGREQNLQS